MTSKEIADLAEKCGEAADVTDAAAWLQVKMLAEIAYQLAVANERAATPSGERAPGWTPAY